MPSVDTIKWGDFVRRPPGSVEVVEVDLDARNKLSSLIQSYAMYADARVRVTLVNGFNMRHEPIYLLRAEVIKQGRARKLAGRKKRDADEE